MLAVVRTFCAIFTMLAALACSDPVIEDACANQCTCLNFLPSQQRVCTELCVQQGVGAPQECIDCVAASTCDELDDGACNAPCAIVLPGTQ